MTTLTQVSLGIDKATWQIYVNENGTWYPISFPQSVTTVNDLRSLTPVLNQTVETLGYYATGDGGGGSFYGVTGAPAGTYVDNGGTIIVPTGGDGSAAWLRVVEEELSVAMFGAFPSQSASTNTTAINNAISAMPATGAVLAFQSGTYYVTNQKLYFYNKTNFQVEGNQAVIKVANGQSISVYSTQDIFFVEGCTDGTIQNITADGNRDNRLPAPTTSTSSLTIGAGAKTLTVGLGLTYETGEAVRLEHDINNMMAGLVLSYDPATGVMNVNIIGFAGAGTYNSWTVHHGECQSNCFTIWSNCKRLKFVNCVGQNSINDCYYVVTSGTLAGTPSTYPTDITLTNCTAYRAHRNGLSAIASVRLSIQGGRFSNSIGTNPQAGIGFEPDSSGIYTYGNSYPSVSDVELDDNTNFGMYTGGGSALQYPNTYVHFKNIRGKNNGQGLLELSKASRTMIDGIFASEYSTLYRGVIDIHDAINTQVTNVSLEYITSTSFQKPGIFVQSDADNVQISNVRASTLSCPIVFANIGITVDDVVGTGLTNYGIFLAAGSQSVVRNVTINGSSGPGVFVGAVTGAVIENITLKDMTNGTAALWCDATGTKPYIKNVSMQNCSNGPAILIEAPDSILENVTVSDATSATAAISYAATALRPTLKNIGIYQSAAPGVGAYGIKFLSKPYYINGVNMYVNGGSYSTAQSFYFGAGFDYSANLRSWMTNCRPNPLSAFPDVASAGVPPGSGYNLGTINAGATVSQNIAFASASVVGTAMIGIYDEISVKPGSALSGLVLTCYVSAADQATITIYNPTAGNVVLPRTTWIFSPEKKPSP